MGKIKFRAWDGDKMYYPSDNENEYELSMDGDFWCIQEQVAYDNPDCYANSEDDNDLMQFTGLQDKSGTDIYEGDIIYEGIGEDDNDDLYIVSWGHGAFVWEHYKTKRQYNNYGSDYTKVIGNIHENPELLK